jgi:MFS family permease
MGPVSTARPGGKLDREILVLGGVLVLGMFPTVLDLTIVNVAVPTLGREFSTSISTIQWVMTGYMLAFAAAGLDSRVTGSGAILATYARAEG